MKLAEFKAKVDEHPDLRGLDICIEEDPEQDYFVIQCVSTGVIFRVRVYAVDENDWETLEPILLGKEQASNLKHITRVVGYFSRIENWNPSKVGEHKARRRGHYGVGGEDAGKRE